MCTVHSSLGLGSCANNVQLRAEDEDPILIFSTKILLLSYNRQMNNCSLTQSQYRYYNCSPLLMSSGSTLHLSPDFRVVIMAHRVELITSGSCRKAKASAKCKNPLRTVEEKSLHKKMSVPRKHSVPYYSEYSDNQGKEYSAMCSIKTRHISANQ